MAHLHSDASQLYEAGSKHLAASIHLDGHRLTRNRGLIDRGLTVDDLTIYWKRLARPNNDHLSNGDCSNRENLLTPITFHTCCLRCKGGQTLDSLTGTLCGKMLGIVANTHKEDNHDRRWPLSNRESSHNTQAHERMRDDLATERSFDDVPENGSACEQDKAQYCELKAKGGKERTESSKSGILSERKKEGTFSCTDYGNWM
jgi:hypothetical protein